MLAAVLALSMTACASEKETKDVAVKKEEPIKVLAPMGAPSLALLGLYGKDNVTIDTVDGSDVLSAQMAKADSAYDVILAPINMGAMLISKGKSSYQLDSVVTWGNLYLVGTDKKALQEEGMLAAFGEKAVPQKVLLSSVDMNTITPQPTYFNSANEVQAQLLSGKAKVGLLAEPAATATIAKAKEKGKNFTILMDLQKAYKEKQKQSQEGYPQAALFVKKGSEEKVAAYIKQADAFVQKADDASITKAVKTATTDKLGIPNAQIAVKTWKRQNIRFVKARDVQKEVATFLAQFKLTLKDSAYTK